MNKKNMYHIDVLIKRIPLLSRCQDSIIRAYEILESCFLNGNKLLIVGNGGSCADAEHIVGELMKNFKLQRKCSTEFANKLKRIDPIYGEELSGKLQGALPSIALHCHASLNTAFINDVKDGGSLIFAQQVYGYGKKGDVLFCISTSGNSKNVLYSAVVARALGIQVIALTGNKGGELAKIADVAIRVPADETYMVQELHIPIYHCLCLLLEERFFGGDFK